MQQLDSAILCARYAFAPNFYQLCGPDTHGELGEYLMLNQSDVKLSEYISQFNTLYPYLVSIATANGIKNPLDRRVVDAYWVGNDLLKKVSPKDMFLALTEKQNLSKRLLKKDLKWLLSKIDKRAQLHHSFHVFNVWERTGNKEDTHTIESMDLCRISFGRIKNIGNKIGKVVVESQKLVYEGGKLKIKLDEKEAIVQNKLLEKSLRLNDYISMHWGFVCDKLNLNQVYQLRYYTRISLELANQTI